MYNWGFCTTSSFNLRNLNPLMGGAERSAPHAFLCTALLGDRLGTSHSRFDGQTPGLRGSCLSCSRPPSRLRLLDLFQLLLRFRLLLRRRLFDLFLLLLWAQSSSDCRSLVLERPRSCWLGSARPRPTPGRLALCQHLVMALLTLAVEVSSTGKKQRHWGHRLYRHSFSCPGLLGLVQQLP